MPQEQRQRRCQKGPRRVREDQPGRATDTRSWAYWRDHQCETRHGGVELAPGYYVQSARYLGWARPCVCEDKRQPHCNCTATRDCLPAPHQAVISGGRRGAARARARGTCKGPSKRTNSPHRETRNARATALALVLACAGGEKARGREEGGFTASGSVDVLLGRTGSRRPPALVTMDQLIPSAKHASVS
jgi:hypothetical protein